MKIFHLFIVVLCFASCKSDSSELINAKLKTIAQDGIIDDNEINQLKAKPIYKSLWTNNEVDTAKVQMALLNLRLPKVRFQTASAIVNVPTYNVFLENSGSMDGYVNGRTAFESSIYSFLSDINGNEEVAKSLNLYYINSEKIYFDSTIKDFIEKLSPKTFKSKGGILSNSDIANILEETVKEANNDTVCVFISDCLFSLTSVNNAQSYLINQSIGIKTIFTKKLNKNPNFATLVIQLSSDFTGSFYTYDNKVEKMDKQSRPYYVWIMGNHQYIKTLMSKIDIESSMKENIENYYCWSASNNNIDYRTTTLNMIGSFMPDKEKSLTKIYNVKKGNHGAEKGIFQFSVAVDLKGFGLDNDYLIDKNNYALSDDNFEIEEVREISEKEIKQLNYPITYSHLIVLKTKKTKSTDLEISLKQDFPTWINDWHWEPDATQKKYKTEDELKKSFGLKYLLEGVHDAYKGTAAKENNFFTLIIEID